MSNYDLVVIGEGVAGLTCAGRAAGQGLSVATVEASVFGGLVINIAELEGYPGASSGVDLASKLMEDNANAGVTSINATVSTISGSAGAFQVSTDSEPLSARAIVIAAGARFNKLGVPGEAEFDHKGVSQCADCDGPMFANEHVVVVGGGDSAFHEARALAGYTGKVTVLMRGSAPRARPALVEHVRAESKINLRPGVTVEAILGSNMVEGVRVRPSSGGASERIDCAGVFVFVGLTPNAEMAPASVKRTPSGHIETDAELQSSLPGIYALGAVRAGYSGRLVDAEAEARKAADRIVRALA